MSADNCGCDDGAKHKCADHKIRAGLLTIDEVKRDFMIWRAAMLRGGFAHADQNDFFALISKSAEADR